MTSPLDLTTIADAKAWLNMPTLSGACNTNGVDIAPLSGNSFTPNLAGVPITINGIAYTVQAYIPATGHITLSTSAGVQANVAWSSGSSDNIVQRLITSCSTLMLTLMNRVAWASTTINETRNGTGTSRIALRYWPVIAVNTVTVSNAVIPKSPDGVQYGWVTDGYSVMIVNCGYPGIPMDSGGLATALGLAQFVKGYQNVVINYQYGWTPVPSADMTQACIELVSQRLSRRDHVDLDSLVAAPGQSTKYQPLSMPREVLEVIKRYRIIPLPEL